MELINSVNNNGIFVCLFVCLSIISFYSNIDNNNSNQQWEINKEHMWSVWHEKVHSSIHYNNNVVYSWTEIAIHIYSFLFMALSGYYWCLLKTEIWDQAYMRSIFSFFLFFYHLFVVSGKKGNDWMSSISFIYKYCTATAIVQHFYEQSICSLSEYNFQINISQLRKISSSSILI